jgi:hypothetical protein
MSNDVAATKRCSRCGRRRPLARFAVRTASSDGHQNYCRDCHAEWSRARRPKKLAEAPVVGQGEKWCRRCETTRPVTDFAGNRSARDGLQAYCRECGAAIYRERRERDGHVARPGGIPDGHKFCRTCGEVKPHGEWSLNARASDGLQTRCKACASAAGRRDHLSQSYGLATDDVAELLADQSGICVICLRRPAIHVDHDHATGAVRGMLCFRCNAGLGQFSDDVGLLARAAEYLQGRKMSIRTTEPGVFRLTYPEDAPAATGAARGTNGREAVGIGPLLAKARGA